MKTEPEYVKQKLFFWFILLAIVISSILLVVSSSIASLPIIPKITPQQYLENMPYVAFTILNREIILIQPSSTIFVYLLGILIGCIGIYFIITRKDEKSRLLWGVGLIFWGAGTIAAGTSYQAFGYELKCRGKEFCQFTSNAELIYLLLTAYSINYLVAATGYTSLSGKARKRMLIFAIVDSLFYFLYLLIGALFAIRFMVSYEGFIACIGINFIIMFICNIRHFSQHKDRLNHNLIIIWLFFLFVNIAYFVYMFSGIASLLYSRFGIWFNENDVLHVLLIVWAILVFTLSKKRMKDSAS